jgi:predicted nicotinamide N-methyase
VLAADVLYERRNGEQLLDLLARTVAPGGEALIADPGRPNTKTFIAAAGAWGIEAIQYAELPRGGIYRLRRAA